MALAHSPSIVINGLVLCLDAANQKSYPGTGTAWSNLAKTGINGTLVNGPTFSTANQGILEMAADKWVNLGNSLYYANNSPLTVMGWMRLNTTSSRDMLLSRNNAVRQSGPYTWLFGIKDSGTRLAAYDGGTWREISHSFSTGVWHHISFSYNGTTMTYYVNGNSIGTQSFTYSDSTTGRNTQVGGYSGTTTDINGAYGSVMFYDRGLSPTEIQQNFNALRGRFGI